MRTPAALSVPCPSPLVEVGWLLPQVMEPSVPGARVLVVDCPNSTFLPALLRASVLHGSISTEKADGKPANCTEEATDRSGNGNGSSDSSRTDVVVHLAPVKVLRLLAAVQTCDSRSSPVLWVLLAKLWQAGKASGALL